MCQYKKLSLFDLHQKLIYLAELPIMEPIRMKLDVRDSALLCGKLIEKIQNPARTFAERIEVSLASEDLYDSRLVMADKVLQGDEYGKFLFGSGVGGGGGDLKQPKLKFFATCLEYSDRIGVLVSKYGPRIVRALKRFPLPEKADEMDDTAREKHASSLVGCMSGQLLPEEVARRLRIGKLYHEFKYCRWLGSPSKRDQFFAANPDCVLGARLMTKAVAAYKKQAEKH